MSEMSVGSAAEKIIFELHAARKTGLIGPSLPGFIVKAQDSQNKYKYSNKKHQTNLFPINLMAKIILSSVDIQYLFFVKKQYKKIVGQITNYVRGRRVFFNSNSVQFRC